LRLAAAGTALDHLLLYLHQLSITRRLPGAPDDGIMRAADTAGLSGTRIAAFRAFIIGVFRKDYSQAYRGSNYDLG
jgi:hypothetical protein